MFDKTDTYFSFTCDHVDTNGRHEIDFIRYDRLTDKVTFQTKWYNVCGQSASTYQNCPAWQNVTSGGTNPAHDTNLMRMNQHPTHGYITVVWQASSAQCGSTNSQWHRGCGTEIFGDTYGFLGPAANRNVHQDVGYDVNGVPVFVQVGAAEGDIKDERALTITNLTTLSKTAVVAKRILLPCSYSRQPGCDSGQYLYDKAGASHISMTGTWGSVPGYGLLSTMEMAGAGYWPAYYPKGTALGTAVSGPGTVTVTPASMSEIGVGVVSTVGSSKANLESVTWTAVTSTTAKATFKYAHAATDTVTCLSCGDTGFAAMENVAIKIDTQAADSSNAIFYRLGRTMGIRNQTYNAEPHTAVNRDFTQFVWGSTWNQDPANSGVKVYGFWTKLP
jgi:hypothetical protein